MARLAEILAATQRTAYLSTTDRSTPHERAEQQYIHQYADILANALDFATPTRRSRKFWNATQPVLCVSIKDVDIFLQRGAHQPYGLQFGSSEPVRWHRPIADELRRLSGTEPHDIVAPVLFGIAQETGMISIRELERMYQLGAVTVMNDIENPHTHVKQQHTYFADPAYETIFHVIADAPIDARTITADPNVQEMLRIMSDPAVTVYVSADGAVTIPQHAQAKKEHDEAQSTRDNEQWKKMIRFLFNDTGDNSNYPFLGNYLNARKSLLQRLSDVSDADIAGQDQLLEQFESQVVEMSSSVEGRSSRQRKKNRSKQIGTIADAASLIMVVEALENKDALVDVNIIALQRFLRAVCVSQSIAAQKDPHHDPVLADDDLDFIIASRFIKKEEYAFGGKRADRAKILALIGDQERRRDPLIVESVLASLPSYVDHAAKDAVRIYIRRCNDENRDIRLPYFYGKEDKLGLTDNQSPMERFLKSLDEGNKQVVQTAMHRAIELVYDMHRAAQDATHASQDQASQDLVDA